MKRRQLQLLFAFLSSLTVACSSEGHELVSTAAPSPVATSATDQATDTPTSAVIWLKNSAIPFETSQPGSGYDDLQSLKQIVGPARIVALGEATHGTHEFFEMKHRMLQFLVEEMGFTVFAIEANWPEANLINDYVHTGKGDPGALLSGLYFWTWDTDEVLSMILWMREYNKRVEPIRQVSFLGFDSQIPVMAVANVIEYLQAVDREAATLAREWYDCVPKDVSGIREVAGLLPAQRAACWEGTVRVYDHLVEKREAYERASGPTGYAHAVQSALVTRQGVEILNAGGDPVAVPRRDKYMADNIDWLLDQAGPGARMVIWAHNGHVGVNNYPIQSMGWHLRSRYRRDMVVFGFDFYAGSFNAFGMSGGKPTVLGVHSTEPPSSRTIEAFFATAGLPRMFVDLRSRPGLPAPTWVQQSQPMRFVGARYDDGRPGAHFAPTVLSTQYDVIVYFQETTPSRLRTR